MRSILFILTLLIVSWFVWRHYQTKTESSVALPVVKMKTDNRLIDSLRHQLQATIDSLNSYKPAIEKAIQKLRYYDSVFLNSNNKASDTVWIKRMRSDLYEARQEIRRLCVTRYYKIYFKSE